MAVFMHQIHNQDQFINSNHSLVHGEQCVKNMEDTDDRLSNYRSFMIDTWLFICCKEGLKTKQHYL